MLWTLDFTLRTRGSHQKVSSRGHDNTCTSVLYKRSSGIAWGNWVEGTTGIQKIKGNMGVLERERWRRQWQPTPVLLPGKSHGWRSLVGYSLWGRKELDMTEQLHFHFSISCIAKEMETHSSVLAWRLLGMVEPGGLLSMGSDRVGHD